MSSGSPGGWRAARRSRQRLASRTMIGVASTSPIRARASSASSIRGGSSAARGAREEDDPVGPGGDVAVGLHQLRLAPAAAAVRRGHGGPHALVELAAELLDEPLLLLADLRVPLGEEDLSVAWLHAQELDDLSRNVWIWLAPVGRPPRGAAAGPIMTPGSGPGVGARFGAWPSGSAESCARPKSTKPPHCSRWCTARPRSATRPRPRRAQPSCFAASRIGTSPWAIPPRRSRRSPRRKARST